MSDVLTDDHATRTERYERTMWLLAIALSLLISHELDAMIRGEWNLLPGFGGLSESAAADTFNLLHVPLFAAIIIGVMSSSTRVRMRTAMAVEVFLIGHAIAHTALRGAEEYRFEAPVETITVYGAALFSLVHLSFLRPSSERQRPVARGATRV